VRRVGQCGAGLGGYRGRAQYSPLPGLLACGQANHNAPEPHDVGPCEGGGEGGEAVAASALQAATGIVFQVGTDDVDASIDDVELVP
jgi:hypothetical protein